MPVVARPDLTPAAPAQRRGPDYMTLLAGVLVAVAILLLAAVTLIDR